MGDSLHHWNVDFLRHDPSNTSPKRVLVILNQPFSFSLLRLLWNSTCWHCCADGGANRLLDTVRQENHNETLYLPELIKGDLDSLRSDVHEYYASQGVPVEKDEDQDSTDLMKCMSTIAEKEKSEGTNQYEIVILGGLAGRLDQTIHTLSYLYKLRKVRDRVYAVTDDNVCWVLDSGEHIIEIDHTILGITCGLLPVGTESTILSTSGLRWNLTNCPSSFDGLVSTSNHLVSGENVWVKTSKPIVWTVELQ
ncbi:thiamine pyrophosphokinase [Lentinula aciculospora]|uniref:Thiamine pyrophosphokinase n=1 Tax=Lentinula aciculospora TaxID=153920 RepID=A0A9W9AAA7_9AGAR|nr:thiamine pyrophosphokinase [Lentinula aciculospora]